MRPFVLTLFAAPFLGGSPALASTLHVDANLTTGANDGSSWDDAFQGTLGLQAALATAVSGDEIFVADGLYLPSGSGARNVSFALQNGVTVWGGFAGGESSPDDRPPFGTSPSILSGDLAGNDGAGSFGDNSFHVVQGAGTNATAILDGFEVIAGNANGNNPNDRGGGILCIGNAAPTIRSCRFADHRSTFGGAAGYCNNGASPSFTDCTFENGQGGAFGGAFDIAGGGAIRFDRCGFFGNRAARAGALEIFATNGTIVSNCVFEGNTATGTGGGGAIWVGNNGNPRFRNITVVGNFSTTNGVAGIRNQGAGGDVQNSIVWGNTGPGGAQAVGNQTQGVTYRYSNVQGGVPGTGNLNADPLFAVGAGGDFALGAGSPCIDAASNPALPPGADFDYVGSPRFQDDPATPDTGNGTAPILDMGAFEFGAPAFVSVPGCFGNTATLDGGAAQPQVGQAFDLLVSSSFGGTESVLFYLGSDGSDAAGCGLLLPGFGEVLLALAPAPFLLGSTTTASGAGSLNVPLPATPTLAGQVLFLQAAVIGLSSPGVPIELSNQLSAAILP